MFQITAAADAHLASESPEVARWVNPLWEADGGNLHDGFSVSARARKALRSGKNIVVFEST
jgi:hypothetical protein